MRKAMIITILAVATVVICYTVFAEWEDLPPGRQMGWGQGPRGWGRGPGMGRMCPTHMMVAKSLTKTEIVAGDDGGVFILTGHKLMKYDNNLKLVKEVELDIDLETIRKRIQEIMDDCPRRKAMIEEYKKMTEESEKDK